MTNSLTSIADRWKHLLGPLGWGAFLVFLTARSFDVISFFTRWYAGSVLSAVDYGALDPVISVVAILCIPITVLLQVSVKSISRLNALGMEPKAKALIRDMMKVALIGSSLVVIIVATGRNFILTRLHLDGTIYTVIIASLFAIAWWYPLLLAIYQGRTNYMHIFTFTVIPAGVMLFFTVVLISWSGLELKGALIARVIGYLLAVLVFVPGLLKSISGLRETYDDEFVVMKQMIVPMSVYLLSTMLLFHFDKLIVRNFLLSDSGGYGAVLTLGAIPANIMGSIVFVVFPLASAEHASGQDLRRFFRQSIIIGGAITIACIAVFALISEPVMRLWNTEFIPYARFVWMYSLVMGLHGLIQIIASIEMARHRYNFLWLILIPTLLMCGLLIACAWRSMLTISGVIVILAGTHILILAGISLYCFSSEQGNNRPEEV